MIIINKGLPFGSIGTSKADCSIYEMLQIYLQEVKTAFKPAFEGGFSCFPATAFSAERLVVVDF